MACVFPFFLFLAQYQLFWLYCAYLSYGIVQSGYELTWNMSGPIFAKNEDSSLYSSVNVLTVGLRGCFVPAIGSLICSWYNSSAVMALGMLLLMLGMLRQASYSKQTRAIAN